MTRAKQKAHFAIDGDPDANVAKLPEFRRRMVAQGHSFEIETCNRSEAAELYLATYKRRLASKNKNKKPQDKEPYDKDWFAKVIEEKLPVLDDGQAFVTDITFIHRDIMANQEHFPTVLFEKAL